MLIVIRSGIFFCFLWIVLFPFFFRPTCDYPIYTFCCFYIASFSFIEFFFTITGLSLNQFNLTILNTKLVKYIYRCCLFSCFPFAVFLILFSMPFHSFTQAFTSASNIAFVISYINYFVNLTIFIPIHTYIYIYTINYHFFKTIYQVKRLDFNAPRNSNRGREQPLPQRTHKEIPSQKTHLKTHKLIIYRLYSNGTLRQECDGLPLVNRTGCH